MSKERELLKRAAERLQDYCSELHPHDNLNDSLATEIEQFLANNTPDALIDSLLQFAPPPEVTVRARVVSDEIARFEHKPPFTFE